MAPGALSTLKATSLVSAQGEGPGRWQRAQTSSCPWFTRQMDDPGPLSRMAPRESHRLPHHGSLGPIRGLLAALPGDHQPRREGRGVWACGSHRRKRKQPSWLRAAGKVGRLAENREGKPPGRRWAHSRPGRTHDGELSRSSDGVWRGLYVGAAFLEGSLEANTKVFRSLTI